MTDRLKDREESEATEVVTVIHWENEGAQEKKRWWHSGDKKKGWGSFQAD